MSKLTVSDEKNNTLQTSDSNAEIAQVLKSIGVRFEQWDAEFDITREHTSEDIQKAYKKAIDQLVATEGYQTVDVISLTSDHPDKTALRQKFLSEHTHSEDEVRFFVNGSGLFFLHVKDKVYTVNCEQGDLISVPANTTHWFDMGDAPDFTAIRLFTNPEGWVAQYTGDEIASSFPKYEDLVS